VVAGAAAVMISVLLAASATRVVGPVAVVLSIVINVVARTRTRRLGALAAAVVALAALCTFGLEAGALRGPLAR